MDENRSHGKSLGCFNRTRELQETLFDYLYYIMIAVTAIAIAAVFGVVACISVFGGFLIYGCFSYFAWCCCTKKNKKGGKKNNLN